MKAGCISRFSGCGGLSLVELLVALAIGAVLSFGAMNLLLSSKLSFLQVQAQARMQENGRYALRYLSRELMMAGYLATRLPGTAVESDESGSPCFDYLLATRTPFEHLDDVSASGQPAAGRERLPADCLLAGQHLAGSDILLVRRTSGSPTAYAGQRLAVIGHDDIYLRDLPGSDSPRLQRGGGALPAGGQLWEYLPQLLFLRNYSSAPGDGIPALCRKRPGRSSNRMAPTECLVEGVENLQLEFGIDDDGDRVADRFAPARGPIERSAAVSARIYLLIRSINPIAGHTDNRAYKLGQVRQAPAGDGYYRRLIETTVLLRNQTVFGHES